jgi:hypothetical protein
MRYLKRASLLLLLGVLLALVWLYLVVRALTPRPMPAILRATALPWIFGPSMITPSN